MIVETKVHCEEPSRVRALTARAAYTVWFTAHESTYPLAHGAAKVMEKVKKMLGKCLQLKNESIKPNQSAIIFFLLAIW